MSKSRKGEAGEGIEGCSWQWGWVGSRARAAKGNHGRRISVSWVEGERLGRQQEPEFGHSLKVLGTMKAIESQIPFPLPTLFLLRAGETQTLHFPLYFFL